MKIRTAIKTTFFNTILDDRYATRTAEVGTEVEIIDVFLMERCVSGIAAKVILPKTELAMTIDINFVLYERDHWHDLPKIISKMKHMLMREESVETFLENLLISTEYGI